MATFRKSSFNTVRYAAARPTYPRQLYDFIFRYHEEQRGAKWELAVDLGCGTGQATTELTPFKRVIGVDPSARMIDQARSSLSERLSSSSVDPDAKRIGGDVEFVQSSAEELKFLEDGSVDLIVAAQACHWFDWNKMWPEAARVLRKNGTAAFWGYSEFRLPSHPHLTPLIRAYTQGPAPNSIWNDVSIGPYWEQPGRRILDDHLRQVPRPTEVLPDLFEDWRESYFTGSYHDLPDPRPTILKKRMSWPSLLSYLRSFSSLHTFKAAHPEDERDERGGVEVRFWRRLQREMGVQGVEERNGEGEGEAKEEGGEGEEGEGKEGYVDVEWPMAVIMVRRK